MWIELHEARCIGAGTCTNAAPELFDVEDGKARLLIDGPVPEAVMDDAEMATALCPVLAIELVPDPPREG